MFHAVHSVARLDADAGAAPEHCTGLPPDAQDERVLLVTAEGIVVYSDRMGPVAPRKSHPLVIQSWLRACGYE